MYLKWKDRLLTQALLSGKKNIPRYLYLHVGFFLPETSALATGTCFCDKIYTIYLIL